MSIQAAYMVPHPPLIIPAVGNGKENGIRNTVESYRKIAAEIVKLRPDTIVISSPHSIMYSDYFHISPGKGAKGDFRQFGVPEAAYSVKYDRELAEHIENLAVASGVQAGLLGEKNPELDHGTMIPIHFINEAYGGKFSGEVIRIGLSGFSFEEHYKMGMLIQKAADDLGRNIVFIASGDLSHRLKEEGPYSYAKEGPEYDRQIMEYAKTADFYQMLMMREDFCEAAGECGQRSFCIMAGALDGIPVEASELSYEGPFGVGYGVVSFHPLKSSGAFMQQEDRRFLERVMLEKRRQVREKRKQESRYVNLARASLEEYTRTGKVIKVPEDCLPEMLNRQAGCFVSLKINGSLRGCIGTTTATRKTLAEEIIQNAISAAAKDPRFEPVREDELELLEVSVDVLGEIEEISSPKELDVKRYGVIVSKGGRRGLLLPNLEGVDTIEQQINIARKKAGISEREDVKLSRFEVVRYT